MLIETGFSADPVGSPPLDGNRAAALLRWRTENDVSGLDEGALRQAAAVATVTMDDGWPAFRDTFRELVRFVGEMPF